DLGAVDRAAFHPNLGNVARWANTARTTTTEAPGFHVRRDDFDRVLRDAAAWAGARIVAGLVRRVDPADPGRVNYVTPTGELVTVHGRQVLDCSGRAGIVAARGFRRADAGYRTIAIAAEWESNAWPIEERARTLVESYADGWAWSVPLSETRRQCTVMIDGGRPAERVALRPMYDRELKKTSLLAGRMEASHAAAVGEPWACDASVYDCQRATDEGVLLVGDAASFIEPLSSAGVKKALLSAWRAAVVTNTTLKHPALASAARDLYSQRERDVYAESMNRAGAFFAEAASTYGSPFWSIRAGQTQKDVRA